MEIWKEVKDYEGIYQVSNLGRIKSLSRLNLRGFKIKEKIIKGGIDTHGYQMINLTKDGIRKTILVHRLVSKHYICNAFDKPDVNHKNGIKTDNRVSNLEWSTTQENVTHAYENGLCSSKTGAENGRALLNESQVLEIRQIKNKKISKIAIEYNVSWSCISSIINRKTWTHI